MFMVRRCSIRGPFFVLLIVLPPVHGAFTLRGFRFAYLLPILRRMAVRSAGAVTPRSASQRATVFGGLMASLDHSLFLNEGSTT